MKETLRLMAFAMMAVFSLTFVSCSDDDDDSNDSGSSKNQIELNGKKYPLSDFYSYCTWSEWFDEEIGLATIVIPVKTNRVPDYGFGLETFLFMGYTKSIKVGDDIANWMGNIGYDEDWNLIYYGPVEMYVDAAEKDLSDKTFIYKSGSAKIIEINKSNLQQEESITIKFNNFTMVCEDDDSSYTFNGTVTLPFAYD